MPSTPMARLAAATSVWKGLPVGQPIDTAVESAQTVCARKTNSSRTSATWPAVRGCFAAEQVDGSDDQAEDEEEQEQHGYPPSPERLSTASHGRTLRCTTTS